VIHQIITGAAAIHSSGIIHGGAPPLHEDILYLTSVADFHPGNFGFAAPELKKFSDIDLWDRMQIQDLFPPVSTSRTRNPIVPSLPIRLC
jgi:hypothetical protein